MLSLRTAARLLADAGTLQALTPLARMLGCDGPPHSLDARLRDAIGAPTGDGWRINVASGPEPLRALLVEAPRESALRDAVAHIARRLAARAPDALWALVATQADGAQLVIASWSAARHPPRVVALTVDRAHVVDSDADTLRLLAAAAGDAPLLAHGAWLDILGRDALTRRFYRVLERTIAGLAESATGGGSGEARRELALLCLSRLLFLSFIEAKGWLDEDRGFLARAFTGCPGNAHERLLLPLFFGTLNTPVSRRAERARRFGRIPFLNGGLFARTPLERQLPRARFPDHALAAVFDDLLLRYRFTAREDHASWSDAAVDPEMLGRAFESLMASDDRRRSGAFYTPHRLVAHVTEQALRTALAAHAGDDAARRALTNEPVSDHEARRLRCAARELRVLDPACGSGAFLVHALETLAGLAVTLGDTRPLATIRRERLTAAIFGVDVNPMAVWLCELRLWLSTVIECDETDPMRVPSLPNLDRHIRTGDALMGGAFASCGMEPAGGVEARRLAALRGRYARATGVRKRTLARALEREERLAADRAVRSELVAAESRRRELVACVRAPDLFGQRPGPSRLERTQLAALRLRVRQLRARQRALAAGAGLPFAFATHFPDVAASSGFGLVFGNPPWVRPHHVDARTRTALRERFATARGAAWAEGAR
ncbi:MAG TPA: N-6 DNA methylase, partial [Gemmatimonadaceae bacterium]|nr:N-6 DNA methylase [Gemmatimonadaceae bacterium]